MTNQTEADKFLKTKTAKSSKPPPKGCCSKWWYQAFANQQPICDVLESTRFLIVVIVFVVIDTVVIVTEIMLDFVKLQHECRKEFDPNFHHESHEDHERLELALKILHYVSIFILTLFVFELILKLYAFGREFWNIHRRKMEYFDAIIVIASLTLDLYFLRGEEQVLGKRSLLIISFRLWRFARIINSVAECVRENEKEHKRNLNKQYLVAIQRLIGVIVHKTAHIQQETSDDTDKFNSIIEYFARIDSQCEESLQALNENHELTSSLLVAQFNEQLNKFDSENGDTDSPKDQNLSEV